MKKLFWLFMVFFFLVIIYSPVMADDPTPTPYRTPVPITITPRPLASSTPFCGTPVPVGSVSNEYISRCAQCVTGLTPQKTPTSFIFTQAPTKYYGTFAAAPTEQYTVTPQNPVLYLGSAGSWSPDQTTSGLTSSCTGSKFVGGCFKYSYGSGSGKLMYINDVNHYWTLDTGSKYWVIQFTQYGNYSINTIEALCAASGSGSYWRSDQSSITHFWAGGGTGNFSTNGFIPVCYGDYYGSPDQPTPEATKMPCGQSVVPVTVELNDGYFDPSYLTATDGNILNYDRTLGANDTGVHIVANVNKNSVTKVRVGQLNGMNAQIYNCAGTLLHNNAFGSLTQVGWDFSPSVCISRVEVLGYAGLRNQFISDAIISDGCDNTLNDCRNTTSNPLAETPFIQFISRTCSVIYSDINFTNGWLGNILSQLGITYPGSGILPGLKICVSNYSFSNPKLLGVTIPITTILIVGLIVWTIRKYYKG
jgi:hypothetical protein